MATIKPYQIKVPQAKIDKLQQKLALTDFPDELPEAAWDMGTPLFEVRRLVEAWKTWDWRQAEKKLNKLPHYCTEIEVDGFGSLNIHFLHRRSENQHAIPLLFIHGWPGSFIESRDILDQLASAKTLPSFHVVAPSLPNYGFSDGVRKRGFALAQYAETMHKLMLALGYTQYVTQGGDWGSWITRTIGHRYPEACVASHLNMIYSNPPAWTVNPVLKAWDSVKPRSAREKQDAARKHWFDKEGYGYNLLQKTRPQTLAYALTDSPVALLAWLYEKMHDWTDAHPWSDDDVLTWVSIYAFSTAGPGAAGRIYYEVRHVPTGVWSIDNTLAWNGRVKMGVTHNPKELHIFPRHWVHTMGPIVFEAENGSGGHFYAVERPEWLVADLKKMFGKGGGAYAVVEGRDGYGGDDVVVEGEETPVAS